jgi:4-hydroxyacetophenone monooxygenase
MRFDEDLAKNALDAADLNALRIALLQATGDQALADMQVDDVSVRGGATIMKVLNPRHYDEVKRAALDFLHNGIDTFTPGVPTAEELRTLMETLVNETLTDDAFAYRRNILAFDDFPSAADWTAGRPDSADGFKVIIVGAGFSGVAIGVQLTRLGIPYVIFERRCEVGGVWSINTYPDARVDTTIFSYKYSFEKNYPFSEYFARQHEVRSYVEDVAKKWEVFDNIAFNSDVLGGSFDADTGVWTITVKTETGEEQVSGNMLVTASGLFATPQRLNVPGIDRFQGELVHTTEWTEDKDLTGKRVAVIGNGSTGVQLLKRVASSASHVDVYQRTAQWISPRERYGEPISPETRWLLNTMPYYSNWHAYSMAMLGFGSEALQVPDPEWQAKGGLMSERNDALRASLTDYIKAQLDGRPDLVEKLVPNFAPYARRLIVDNGWYTTLLEPHVELVTDGIQAITPTGIRTEDGAERPTDMIISATGFAVAKYLSPAEYRNGVGKTLNEAWAEYEGGPRAYLGMTVPGFQNFFMMYGPNSQNRSGQLIAFIETWAHYIAEMAVVMVEKGYKSVDIKHDVFLDYNERLDKLSEQLIWAEAASKDRNYYVNEYGRQGAVEPWPMAEYSRMARHPNLDEFIVEKMT